LGLNFPAQYRFFHRAAAASRSRAFTTFPGPTRATFAGRWGPPFRLPTRADLPGSIVGSGVRIGKAAGKWATCAGLYARARCHFLVGPAGQGRSSSPPTEAATAAESQQTERWARCRPGSVARIRSWYKTQRRPSCSSIRIEPRASFGGDPLPRWLLLATMVLAHTKNSRTPAMPPRVRVSSTSEDRRTWGCAFQLNGLTEA
jgi:hypothetical protein